MSTPTQPASQLLKKPMTAGASLWLALLIAILMCSAGCSAIKLPSYEMRPPNYYANVQVKNGLAVAIHPLIDKHECKKYFGVDLMSADILA